MRSNQMQRVVAMLLCAVLLIGSLASCSGPDLSGMSGDELRTYTAMRTENFKVTGSMYAYFFLEIGAAYVSGITQEELDERNFDENKTLKQQKYDKDRTWYEYIGDYVNTEVKNLLVMCEAAVDAGITLNNDDYTYVNEQLTGIRMQVVVHYQTDYNSYLADKYFGYVNEQDVTEVMLMETLAAKYDSYLEEQIKVRMTQERIDEQLKTVTGERDETVTRNLGHILVSYGNYDEDQAYENIKAAKTRFEEQGKTDAAFEAVWKEFSEDANMIYENLRQGDMVESIDSWLYAEGRAVGDVGIISSDDGCHLLYYHSEGDKGYIADAKTALYDIIAEEIMNEARAKYKITVKKNVLNAIDV